MRSSCSSLLLTLMATACDSLASEMSAYIIMANSNTPTKADRWTTFGKDVVKAINNHTAVVTPEFGIVNGDITEFGKPAQRAAFDQVYNELRIPFYRGLGDHEYHKNIDDCTTPSSNNRNACAYSSVKDIEDRFARYSKVLTNFRADRIEFTKSLHKGSMAYSWDHKTNYNMTNHFVQLHLAPTYSVKFDESTDYYIGDSLSFLRDDLDQARRRGVDHIFLNFHALEWINKANAKEQRILKAIVAEYKVSAVFVGHTHKPRLDHHSVFGGVPIYTTGALYLGYFDSLTVTKDDFQVTTYKVNKGAPELFVTRDKVARPAPPPQCYEPGAHVSPKKGQFIRTKFINDYEEEHYFRHIRTNKVLQGNDKGTTFVNEMRMDNGYEHWKFQFISSDAVDNQYYKLIHQYYGRVLTADSKGDVYGKWWKDYDTQYWRVIKYNSGALVQLQNLSTGDLLDINRNGDIYASKGPLNLTSVDNNWEILDLSGKPMPNVRYFEPRSEDSWKHPVPSGIASDTYWKYLGGRALDFAAPCIWNGLI